MTLVKAIPLPLFILILSAFSIALFRYAIYAYKTKNRDAFLPVLVAAFGGPIAFLDVFMITSLRIQVLIK